MISLKGDDSEHMKRSGTRRRCRVCLVGVVCFTASAASARTIPVPAGGDLQAALVAAQPGDTIELAAGAVYTGTFTLFDKGGSAFITLRTAGEAGLPLAGERIGPEDAPRLAKLRSGSSQPAIVTAPGAHHWRLELLELLANAGGGGDVIALGDGSASQTALSEIPHDLVLDRLYVHGDPQTGQKRGIALNSGATTITGCYVSDIKAVGQDSQAIAGWNGPGPYTIANDYLEAAGENVLFGGADPAVRDLVPSDITIANSRLAKPPEWRGQRWLVKNLLELKNARRVTIRGNVLEYTWHDGQAGYAVLFTVRNQDGGCPWCQVDHVRFEGNVVRHSAAAFQILGYDTNHASRQTNAIAIVNNVFSDIDGERWGGNGYFLTLTNGARDITIDHNTIVQDHASGVVQLDGPPIVGFTYTNNVSKHDAYGFIGTGHAVGTDSIERFLPASVITGNVLAGGSSSRYPAGNRFPTEAEFEAQFLAYARGDFHLSPASPWRRAGTDGRDLGALFSPVTPPGRRPPARPRLREPV